MDFPTRLETLRRLKKLTQPELARLCEVGTTTLRRWESGEQEPRLGELKKLGAVLGVTVAELLDENVSERVTLRHGALSLDIPTTPEGLAFLEKKLADFTSTEKSPEQSSKAG